VNAAYGLAGLTNQSFAVASDLKNFSM
jgi:hypothetical protein